MAKTKDKAAGQRAAYKNKPVGKMLGQFVVGSSRLGNVRYEMPETIKVFSNLREDK